MLPLLTSALIANGHIEDLSVVAPLIKEHNRIVAVDGGLMYCHALGIMPDLIVGDFDSVSPDLLEAYKEVATIVLPRAKDETDLEVALEHELQKSQTVTLFGALGKRVDHSLTNLLIATRHPGRIFLQTEQEKIFAIHGDMQIKTFIGQTLSLVPINGPVPGIITEGLQWELGGRTLDASFVGVSNVCLQEQIRISVPKGVLLCILLQD